MKPEYIGVGNFDEDNYVYAYCKCPLPVDYAIKWPRIKDGKVHRYSCICEGCGTEVEVMSKSYGKEVYKEMEMKAIKTAVDAEQQPCEAETDDKCQSCEKDWTKCTRCPVMMKWVKEHKKEVQE